MLGNVLRNASGAIPFSNGVYRFGSNVSVWAMPPAIHRTITVSAVAFARSAPTSSASNARGKPADNADRVATLADLRKSRRFKALPIIRSQWLLNTNRHRSQARKRLERGAGSGGAGKN